MHHLRMLACGCIVALLCAENAAARVAVQDGDPQQPKKRDEPAPPAPLPPVVDSNADAAKQLRDVEKGLALREPWLRAKALEPFLTHRHETYVKRLVAVLKDADESVAFQAARALANQPFASCTDALLDFAANPRNLAERGTVVAATIRSLAVVGLGKKGYERLRDAFDAGTSDVRVAICQTFADQKEKRAFSFFVDHLDAPAPADPNSASNPPESYWRNLHEQWSTYKKHVAKGLRELTGEKFATAAEWRDWAAGPGKKLGFVYAKGT